MWARRTVPVGDDVAPRSAVPRPAWWWMVVILETLRRRGCWSGPLLPAHYSPATPLLFYPPLSNSHIIDIHPLSDVIQGGTSEAVVARTVEGLVKAQLGAALCGWSNSETPKLAANVSCRKLRKEHSSSTSFRFHCTSAGLRTWVCGQEHCVTSSSIDGRVRTVTTGNSIIWNCECEKIVWLYQMNRVLKLNTKI